MRGDGDGWVECGRGHRHWGKHGAAGLLLYTVEVARPYVLLQHRAPWCHHGDTWGVPGGARDSEETAVAAALRESYEEARIDGSKVTVRRQHVDDHGGWTYTTVVATSPRRLTTEPNDESLSLVWHDPSQLSALKLHPGFAATWQQTQVHVVDVVVDGATTGRSAGPSAGLLRSHDDSLTSVPGSPQRWRQLPDGRDVLVASWTVVAGPDSPGNQPDVRVVHAKRHIGDEISHLVAASSRAVVVSSDDPSLQQRWGATVVGRGWLSSLG